MRFELSAAQRASGTARRKAIYVELHPDTAHGVAGAHASNRAQGNAAANLATVSFTDATAAATGRDARSVRRDAERGTRRIEPDALAAVSGTPLDRGRYLDALKIVPPAEQVAWVERDLAERVFPAALPTALAPEITFEVWIEEGRRWLSTGTPEFQARAREALPFPVTQGDRA